MKRFLWISRHEMTEEQSKDLKRIISDEFQVVVIDKTVDNISEIKDAVNQSDIVGAVLPIEKMAELKKITGAKMLIQSVSERIMTDEYKLLPDGRKEKEVIFKHKYWQEIVKLEIETKIL